MSEFERIKRCLDLTERDIAAAVGERRSTRLLLEHLAKVSRPGEGASKVLLVFGRIAADEVPWLEGGLRVELTAKGDDTSIETKSELGLGMHERIFPVMTMNAPLREFARHVEHMPQTIEPLTIASRSPRQIVIAARSDAANVGREHAPVAISDDSLFEPPRRRSTNPKLPAPRQPSQPEIRRTSKPAEPARRNTKPVEGPRRTSKPMEAARRASKPIPAASARPSAPPKGNTQRPVGMAAPAPTRTKTMRPAVTGVPPHRKSLPNFAAVKTPRLPRIPIRREEPEEDEREKEDGEIESER